MNWKKYYEDNLVSAMEAVNEIKSGDAVVFAHAAGEPKTLVDAMVANAANYKDVTVSHMVTMGDGAYTRPEYKDNFTFNGWFLSGTTRKAVDYVNHPIVVAENSKLVCINSALQVDFLGQVVSDSIGTRQFSGVGGQVDFMRGAAMAKDGKAKAIIAMPSVTVKKDGTMISKIVPFIDEGAAVTATRHDADYIITEYGIAHIKGKTLKERARALVEIAHPKFREGLKRQFETRFNCEY